MCVRGGGSRGWRRAVQYKGNASGGEVCSGPVAVQGARSVRMGNARNVVAGNAVHRYKYRHGNRPTGGAWGTTSGTNGNESRTTRRRKRNSASKPCRGGGQRLAL